MIVSIIENDSGKVVARYPIILSGLNCNPTEKEYYSEAWNCAVDDEIVSPDDRVKYSFSISEE